MKGNLVIATIKGGDTQNADRLYRRHNQDGIPYIELRQGKKYGEVWFETPHEIPFNPQSVFALREWYESYWNKRKNYRGLQPYQFSIGPTAVWFKFTLQDKEVVITQLSKLSWGNGVPSHKTPRRLRVKADRFFWDYAEKYFAKSRSMRRKRGQSINMSE